MRRVTVILTLIGSVAAIQQPRAQGPAPTPMTTSSIPHVGIIVKDIAEASRRVTEIFGVTVPKPQDVGPLQFRGTPPPNAAASKLKVAAFRAGNFAYEIVQPIAGPSPHQEFFDRAGQGLQHVAFEVKNTQAGVDYLVSKGGTWTTVFNVEMRNVLGFPFSFEVRQQGAATAVPASSPVVAQTPMTNAVVTHVGLVTADIDKTTRQFSEIFGVVAPKIQEVGPLPFTVNPPPDAAKSRLKYVQIKIGDLTIELLQPTAGPTPLKDHLDKFGPGLHHLSFDVKDSRAAIDFLVSKGGKWTMAPYVDMRDILGYTVELRTAP